MTEEIPEEFVEMCDMEFYMSLGLEAYDVVNIAGYFSFYISFQVLGIFGKVFKDAISLAEILKFSYLGYQHMFSAQGLKLYQKQQRWDLFNWGEKWGIGPNFGNLRCKLFKAFYGSFHWAHLALFDSEWEFWGSSSE